MNEKSLSKAPSNPGRFRKGRSGNPGGRPKSSRASHGSAFDIVLERTFTVPHDGGTRELTMEEALQRRTLQDALAGKAMAMREVAKWVIQRETWLANHAPKVPRPLERLLTSPDARNADAALVLLVIAAPDAARADWNNTDRPHLLLEPWAVQSALRRRRGGKRLTDDDRVAIRHRTRDPDSLHWPRGSGE